MKQQSRTTMLILCILLGQFGIHRRLMGYTHWRWMFFTVGGLGLWWFYDIFQLATGKMKMADGSELL
jgi:uncharacterized membrane protein SirB2